uniref:Uncharacterized protein n=1 Tax=Noccaea caerulescens TaxID=107243 RepID=A0A1J3CSN0_NOCCA
MLLTTELLEHPVFTSKTHSLEDSLILIFHLCKLTRLSLFLKTLVGYSVRLLFSAVEKLSQDLASVFSAFP